MKQKSINLRFFEKVNVSGMFDCWLWKASIANEYGYGQFRIGKRMIGSHRASWIIHNGNIPRNMNVLHSCHKPLCVNPNHLRLGTLKENTQDMMSANRHYWAKRTHCFEGHEYSEENTRHYKINGFNYRQCKKCNYEKQKEWRLNQKRN